MWLTRKEYGYNLIAWGYSGYELGNMAITDIHPYTHWTVVLLGLEDLKI